MEEPVVGLTLPNLFCRAELLKDEGGWEPLRQGVDIRRIYQNGLDGPAAALLRYQPGASIPLHQHMGYEHILVLDGTQSDEYGNYSSGSLVIHPPGSSHQVFSSTGCVVLIIWERPPRFCEVAPPPS